MEETQKLQNLKKCAFHAQAKAAINMATTMLIKKVKTLEDQLVLVLLLMLTEQLCNIEGRKNFSLCGQVKLLKLQTHLPQINKFIVKSHNTTMMTTLPFNFDMNRNSTTWGDLRPMLTHILYSPICHEFFTRT